MHALGTLEVLLAACGDLNWIHHQVLAMTGSGNVTSSSNSNQSQIVCPAQQL